MTKRLMKPLLAMTAMLTLMVSGCAQAEAASPDQLVRDVTAQVVQTLEENKDNLSSNEAAELVSEKVLPHFDFTYMSQLVMGRHWRSANAQQRDDFTQAFRRLLVRTYSNSVSEYSGEDVEFLPFRAASDADDVTVRTEIVPRSGPPIPIDYSLHLIDGKWKVYDVNIDGLSLVTNYRRTLGNDIKNNGVDAVINQLQDRNS